MKFKFKIQKYQIDSVNAVTKISDEQLYNGRWVSRYAVFRDSSMVNDSVGTNFEQVFAAYSPNTTRKVL
jgi:hypothetical protein